MKRTHTRLAITSAILCGLLLILCVASYHLDAWSQSIAVMPWFHIGFADGGAYFYNHERPWLYGIIHMSADTNAASPPVESNWHIWGDYGCCYSSSVAASGSDFDVQTVTTFNLPGARFREVLFFGADRSIWTFLLNLWYPILILAVLPAWWIFRRWRMPSRSDGKAELPLSSNMS